MMQTSLKSDHIFSKLTNGMVTQQAALARRRLPKSGRVFDQNVKMMTPNTQRKLSQGQEFKLPDTAKKKRENREAGSKLCQNRAAQ